jgi:hypothetical protein
MKSNALYKIITLIAAWSMKIKRLFDNLGYSHVWLDDNVDFSIYPTIKQRKLDQFYQTWKSDTQNTAKLEPYSNIKEDFKFSNYLTIIKKPKISHWFYQIYMFST